MKLHKDCMIKVYINLWNIIILQKWLFPIKVCFAFKFGLVISKDQKY
jgi:hypothetical protein